uniref:DUF4145 domain-containing protein n=1 Tax=Panagrolaimus sp. ES5 TaxID=591445 RepID=A0AC34FL96_9BILA
MKLINKNKNDVRNVFTNKNYNIYVKEAEFCMGLLYEFDCLKFIQKALFSLKTINIPATKEFTITKNEIITILQAIVFLGESLTNAAGIREIADKDPTIVRTLISLRNVIVHKMSEKKLNDHFWNGLLKELKEDVLKKIEDRLHHLQNLFLERNPEKLIHIENETYLYDATLIENQLLQKEKSKSKKEKILPKIEKMKPMPKIEKDNSEKEKNEKVKPEPKPKKEKPPPKTENEKIEELLKEPAWQCHDYKFSRSFLRALQYRDYNINDPLTENIREIAKHFVDKKPDKFPAQNSARYFYFFINSVLENVEKIEALCENIASETLAEKLKNDSEKNDITLFLKLSYYLDHLCQTFKEARFEDSKARIKEESEIWKKLAKKLYKMGEHRLFEFLYTQIENGRNLCIHHSWINESEYQRFANVICLIISNLKPMFLQLSYRKPIFVQGVHSFTKSLISEIDTMKKILENQQKKSDTFRLIIGNEENNYDAEMLEFELKQGNIDLKSCVKF